MMQHESLQFPLKSCGNTGVEGLPGKAALGGFRESSKKDCIRSPGHLRFVRVYKIINDMQRT